MLKAPCGFTFCIISPVCHVVLKYSTFRFFTCAQCKNVEGTSVPQEARLQDPPLVGGWWLKSGSELVQTAIVSFASPLVFILMKTILAGVHIKSNKDN